MSKALRLALISDIHFGVDSGPRFGSVAPQLVRRFTRWVKSAKADAVIELGDRISAESPEMDVERQAQVAAWFDAVRVPRHHLLGNHDVVHLSAKQNERVLGSPVGSRSITMHGWRIILWAASTQIVSGVGFTIRPAELRWLGNELEKSQKPTIIFTHIPFSNGSMAGNYYFEKTAPWAAGYNLEQGAAIREIIERSKCVVMCINGHTHWNAYQCIDGIHYLTVPSLTDRFLTFPQPSASWSLLTLHKKIARLEVLGNAPATYELPLKKVDHHWMNRDKQYAPRAPA